MRRKMTFTREKLNVFFGRNCLNILLPLEIKVNKISDLMWRWKVSLWRTEDSNYLPKSHHGCKLQCIWLYLILQKYSKVEVFIGSLLQMLKTNDFDWDGWRTFIVQIFWRKMKFFLLAQITVEKAASNQTVRWGKFGSLPRQSLYDP